jgi:hypothetical protein
MERPSEKMWPNRTEEEQDMEMEPVLISPPGYGSPDPETAEGILVPVEESPVELAEDYGKDAMEAAAAVQEAQEGEEAPAPEEEAAEGEEAESEEEDENRPSASATRAEWDEYARSKGVDPDEFSSKEDLIAALS